MIYHDSHEEFDPRDYHSGSTSGNHSVAGLRRDRVIDALRWPLIWLAIGLTIGVAAYSVGYLYDKVKGGTAVVRYSSHEASVSVNRMAADRFVQR